MKKEVLIVFFSLILFMGACTQQNQQQQNIPTGKGTLLLEITDKQVSGLDRLDITISQIEINSNGTWVLFSDETKTFDLMQLNGIKDILGSKELSIGKYNQIRLLVSSAKATINGQEVAVTVPSEKLKLVNEFEINESSTTELIIDFSPESLRKAGDQYILQPTIKVLTLEEFKTRNVCRYKDSKFIEAGYCATNSNIATDCPKNLCACTEVINNANKSACYAIENRCMGNDCSNKIITINCNTTKLVCDDVVLCDCSKEKTVELTKEKDVIAKLCPTTERTINKCEKDGEIFYIAPASISGPQDWPTIYYDSVGEIYVLCGGDQSREEAAECRAKITGIICDSTKNICEKA